MVMVSNMNRVRVSVRVRGRVMVRVRVRTRTTSGKGSASGTFEWACYGLVMCARKTSSRTAARVGDALGEALHERPCVPPQLRGVLGQQVRQAAQPVPPHTLAVVAALHQQLLRQPIQHIAHLVHLGGQR